MKLLFLSSGSRNLLLNELQEKNEDIEIYCADCDQLAPTLHDKFPGFIIPEIRNKNYIKEILTICEQNEIDGVFPLIDPEILIIAENADRFLEKNIIPFVSTKETVAVCFDKLKFFKKCKESDIPVVETYSNAEVKKYLATERLSFPLFAKPNKGSGSSGIGKVSDEADLDYFSKNNSTVIFQKFIEGDEFGVDIYFDYITGEPVSMGIKKKLKMRSGETDKAVTVVDKRIEELVDKLHKTFNFKGPVDVDIFKVGNKYFVSEINPRFGGGYPLSMAAGVDFTTSILDNLQGKASIKREGGRSGIYTMKYFSMKVWDKNE